MTKQDAAEATRRRLLDAAVTTIRQQGANALTLDAVARVAGVSKGGLLHHFRSKDALIEAILRGLFTDFAALVERLAAEEADAPGRWLRAYVRASFDDEPLPMELIALLLSALLENPALLTLVRDDAQRWHERLLNDGLPLARATIIRQAADAYWMDRLLGFPSAHTRDELLKMTEMPL